MGGKKVYILLTDTGTILNRLIKLYTKQPYNHASIGFDLNLSEVYSFGRKTASNPFVAGFAKEDVKESLFRQADCVIYSLVVTEDQWKRLNHFIQAIESRKGDYRYNLFGLLGFMLRKPIKRRNAFFCSQFVAYVLKECNILEFDRSISLIAPNDFQEIPTLELVYQGKLGDYSTRFMNESLVESVPFISIEM
ncbi:hypothetical protein [Lederbergia ruris]|uniref:Uncharacterized protein n=1 Tax=Lederbergia ruris TaxID=217495 RepID=A0ABQ4KMX7_9BACI|nr:hypothetical protein [Lederbergia ruris]GIN58509.1 hypothetical protein J8TS2_28280 [Lederbergia ruris]